MAKKGLDISTIQSVLRDVKDSGGWSLCVGAGTSMPALPDWFSLVEKLINKNCSSKDIIYIMVRSISLLCMDGQVRLQAWTKSIFPNLKTKELTIWHWDISIPMQSSHWTVRVSIAMLVAWKAAVLMSVGRKVLFCLP